MKHENKWIIKKLLFTGFGYGGGYGGYGGYGGFFWKKKKLNPNATL